MLHASDKLVQTKQVARLAIYVAKLTYCSTVWLLFDVNMS
jgi:hypothetical protein